MPDIFADTAGWGHLVDRTQAYHDQAVTLYRQARQQRQLFTERSDKEWSLVDCASFVVMRQRGLLEAFTTDHHFEQAGFVCLLKA